MAIITAVAVVLVSGAAGVAAWLLVRHENVPSHPEISAYSRGQLVRVGPYFYCNVLNLNECDAPETIGTLNVNDRNPIQLSVPPAIGAAPWRLIQVYENQLDSTISVFRPDARLAVTIPTVDRQRGRLTGFTVQLFTVFADNRGELREAPHAEWSVRTDWS